MLLWRSLFGNQDSPDGRPRQPHRQALDHLEPYGHRRPPNLEDRNPFSQTLTFVAGLVYLEKRVSYRRLRKEFGLDDETLEDVRHELIVKRLAVDEGGQGLAFVGTDLFETGNAR